MFKIIKRGQRKSSKPESIEPPTSSAPPPSVTVNHASRSSAAAPPPQAGPNSLPALNSAATEVLPPLKDVPASDRHVLVLRKFQVCCFSFDFSDTLKSAREKEIKRQTLLELLDLVQSGSCKLNETLQEELVKMISVNIFRCLPPASHENSASETGDPERMTYIVSSDTDTKVAKRYIDHSFVLKLLDLFDSEDPREREYLKTILHRIYGKFMVHRPFIRKAINNIFYRFIFETERHSGIGEFLEILGSIINGFALPMKEEHKLFLTRALIPLHKPKSISTYHQQLSYCITQFVEKDYKLADTVIRVMLRCASECKLLACSHVLEEMHKVAERALFLWNNEHIVGLIAQNRQVILPLIFEALERNMQGHWNQAVHGLTGNVRRMFLEMDAELFEECDRQFAEKEARSRDLEEQRELNWKRLEAVACQSSGDHMVMVR
ncbi:hypothetical protein C3L33_16798, partial [Rhododendron williamsianum]